MKSVRVSCMAALLCLVTVNGWAGTIISSNQPNDVIGVDNPGGIATGGHVILEEGAVIGSTAHGTGREVVGGRGQGASQNKVEVFSGIVNRSPGRIDSGQIHGAYATTGGANENEVVIYNKYSSQIIIGRSVNGGLGQTSANNNRVSISGDVLIGDSQEAAVVGGSALIGSADDNTVTIDGDAVSILGAVAGGVGTLSGNRNTVRLLKGSLDDLVAGGVAETNGTAINNTVVIGSAAISGTVYGGLIDGPIGSGDARTGNTLILSGIGGKAGGIENFAHLGFEIPGNITDNATMLHITGAQAADVSGMTLDSGILIDAGVDLGQVSNIVLIDKAEGAFADITAQAAYGTGVADVTVRMLGGSLVASLGQGGARPNVSANPQTSAYGQGRTASVVALNNSTDLLVTQGFSGVEAGWTPGQTGAVTFAAFSLYDQRTKTGSHVDTDGWSLLAGLGWKRGDAGQGWTAGAFFETGRGKYDGFNSFSGYTNVTSRGDTEYFGGGLFGKYLHASGFKLDGSVRAGSVKSEYRGRGFLGGARHGFDLRSAYYGAHLGIGYEALINCDWRVDATVRYLWTRQASDSATIEGERVSFSAVDSHRVQAGGRVAYTALPRFTPFAGAWVEYEMDGRSGATNRTGGYRLASLRTRGVTGIGELGFSYAALPGTDRLRIDAALKGNVGRREGIGGRVGVNVTF